jgi:CNT family concentrative nucleoside transporter
MSSSFRSLMFILICILVCTLFSKNRKKISWKVGITGVLMQVTFAFFLLKFPVIQNLLLIFNEAVIVLETVTLKATQFMFGYLAGAEAPFEIKNESTK